MSSPDYLRSAVEGSLTRMGIDHIDVYQIHRPDTFTHPAAVADVLDEMVASGKVGAVGVSNYSAAQTATLNSFLEMRLVSIQPEFSATHLNPMPDGNFDLAMQHGMIPMAWSPLGRGALATGEGVSAKLLEVMDCIGNGKTPDVGLEQGLMSVAVGAAAHLSIDEGRTVKMSEIL